MKKTLLVCAVAEEIEGLSADLPVLYTEIGKEKAESALRKALSSKHPDELKELTVFNVGTTGTQKYERGTLLYPTSVCGHRNGVLQNIPIEDWGVNRYINCHPVVCYAADVFITEENKHILDNVPHDCVDMEAYVEALVCKEFGVRFISLKLVSDSFNVTFDEWKASLKTVVSNLSHAIETLNKKSII
ncbi:MAG: hypothetical protein LBN37_01800 [Bacteroidales bacterium]|jgi:adenosylhomocysteine nucleosidase|nr:hypothetical protein [Bacteroidales bacterium]